MQRTLHTAPDEAASGGFGHELDADGTSAYSMAPTASMQMSPTRLEPVAIRHVRILDDVDIDDGEDMFAMGECDGRVFCVIETECAVGNASREERVAMGE